MPFARKSPITFAWEIDARKGVEFVRSITSRNVFVYWTRVLRALREGSGILVIKSYDREIGILISPKVLRDVLFAWRGIGAAAYPAIEAQLSHLASIAQPSSESAFRPFKLGVRTRPRSVVVLLQDLASQSGMAVMLRQHVPCAFIVPLSLLARLQQQAAQASPWADGVIHWVQQIAREDG